jgi:peptidoglycan/xylan/chitin deacetylase (PgdA/CDA1 family)
MISKIWQRVKSIYENRAIAVMYHQVCEKKIDPWELAVHPENFEKQVTHMKKNFNVVSADELAHCISRGKLGRNMLVITFDDGFADNYINAVPVLEHYQVPAIFFFTTNPLQTSARYWWDELQYILFESEDLPRLLQIQVGNETIAWTFNSDQRLTPEMTVQIQSWRYGKPVSNERIGLFLKLWEQIKPLSVDDQRTVLQTLVVWSGCSLPYPEYDKVMNLEQANAVARSSLFSIGAHTVSHILMGAHNEPVQRYEIFESKRFLEKMINKAVYGFAYPYGNFNALSQSLLKEAGFRYGFSTTQAMVDPRSDLFALPRIQAKNLDVRNFASSLRQLSTQRT